MSFGASFASVNTKGTNFDSNSWTAYAGLSKELANEVFVDLSGSFTHTQYSNVDTRPTPVGAFARQDTTGTFTLQLSRHIWENISGFGRFNFTSNNSNIAAFTYGRIATEAGIVASF